MRVTATKSSVLRTYEEMAEGFDERRQMPWDDVCDFERALDRQSMILEVGCGTGRNAVHFASMGHRVVAMDISLGMLRLAVKRIRGRGLSSSAHFFQGDASSLPLKDETVSACVYVAALHHLPTRQERVDSLREVARCLRPDGRAIVSVWAFEQKRFKKTLVEHTGRSKGFGDILVPIRLKDGRVVQRFYHLFMAGELEELVTESDLEIERHFKSHDNYFVVAVRR